MLKNSLRLQRGERMEKGKGESGKSQSLFASVGARGIHRLDFLLYTSPHHPLHSEEVDVQNMPHIARIYHLLQTHRLLQLQQWDHYQQWKE